MRKSTALVVIPVSVVAVGGVAWAALGGTVSAPDVITGLATGGGSNSCQTGALTFTLPAPSWDNSLGEYVISSVSYSGVATACVNLGTADVVLNITAPGSNSSLSNGTATNVSSASGTITLSTPLPFDTANTGEYAYLVENS